LMDVKPQNLVTVKPRLHAEAQRDVHGVLLLRCKGSCLLQVLFKNAGGGIHGIEY